MFVLWYWYVHFYCVSSGKPHLRSASYPRLLARGACNKAPTCKRGEDGGGGKGEIKEIRHLPVREG